MFELQGSGNQNMKKMYRETIFYKKKEDNLELVQVDALSNINLALHNSGMQGTICQAK